MTPDEIPQELLTILDEAAGKEHSRDGQVAATLAEILTRFVEIKAAEVASLPCLEPEPDEDPNGYSEGATFAYYDGRTRGRNDLRDELREEIAAILGAVPARER